MAEVNALNRFACPACGADAQWSAAKQALVCPFCGTSSPARISDAGGVIEENDLVRALRELGPEQRGWGGEARSVRCQNCNAISVFEPKHVAKRCEFCGSPALIPVEDIKAPIRPQSLLPFVVPETTVRETVRRWYATRWFAPNRLKTAAMTDTVHGVYLPYWTFDAQVAADWTAESGHYHYETETFRDAQGRLQTRQVRKVRWVPSRGRVEHFFDDELVPASKGVDAELLAKVGDFPTRSELKPYDPGYVSGWVVEQYQIDLVAAAQRARQAMDAKLRALCASRVPGDTHRNLRVYANYSGQTFKHILVPVWLLHYTYGRRTLQVLVNGFTGDIAGRYPKSWVKISLAVFAVLLMLGFLVFLAARH